MGGLFGIKIPKGLGGLLGTAASFIPGVGPVLGGALGGLLSGGGVKGALGGAAGGYGVQQSGGFDKLSGMFKSGKYNAKDLLGAYGAYKNLTEGAAADRRSSGLMGQAGNYLNNIQGLQGSLMGNIQGLSGSLMPAYQNFIDNPLDPTKGMYRSALESAGQQGNNAVDSIMNDFSSRGLLGPNSGLAGAISNARFGTQRAAFQAAHQAALQGRQQRQSELQSGLGALNPLYASAMNTGPVNSLGGLAGQYASKSDAFGDALGTLGGLLGRKDAINQKTPRGATAGQGLLNTNNPAPNPWAGGKKPSGGLLDYGNYNPNVFNVGGRR